jgi:hypothetical protein
MIGFEGGGILYASPDYSDMRLTRINPDGTVQWTKVFSNNLVREMPPIARLPDGGFVTLDVASALDNRKKSGCRLRRFDGGGDLLWTRIIGKDRGTRPIAVSTLPGGELLVACFVNERSGFEYDAIGRLTRLDPAGEVLWQRNIVGAPYVGMGLADGSMAILSLHYRPRSLEVEGWDIARFGPDGEEIWRRSNKDFGAPMADVAEPYNVPALYARAMVPLPGGGFVVLMEMQPTDRLDFIMAMRLSPDGQVLWVRPVAGDDRPTQTKSIIWSVALTPDGKLLIVAEDVVIGLANMRLGLPMDSWLLYALPLD